MTTFDWRHAKAADAAQALDASAELTMRELHAALANALQRVAELEHEPDQLGELLKGSNEMVDASRLHARGFSTRSEKPMPVAPCLMGSPLPAARISLPCLGDRSSHHARLRR